MKKNLTLLSIALLFASTLSAQRLVIIEHFTQASCPPCAALNPALNALLDQNLDKIVAIKYQTSWPGVDPMNAANPSDVQTRVTYYGVNGVPNSLVDGNIYNGSPSGVTQTMINSRHNVNPSVDVRVSYFIISNPAAPSDSMVVTARVKALSAITAGKVLHTAAIEREIEFATAPGSNGEKKFESVMKKMFPSASGTTLPAMTIGDSVRYTFKMSLKRSNGTPVYYNLGQAAAVAFVQDNGSKEVLGAGYDEPRPWLALSKPEGQKSVKMKAGNSTSYSFTLSSKADVDQVIKIKATGTGLPAGWAAKIVSAGTEYSDSALIPLASNTSKDVEFRITGENGSLANSKVKFKVDANSETINPSVKNTMEFTAITPCNILFMDLPGTASARFGQVFTFLNEPALSLSVLESADLDSSGINATNVGKIYYSTGASYSGTLGEYRSETFMNYLNSGGKMLIMGQDIGYELSQGSDASSETFFSEYMGAEYLGDGTTAAITLNRNPADTVCAPFFPSALTLSGTGSYPEQLAVSGMASNGVGFLIYPNGDFGAIYNRGENWKVVYLGFRMEGFAATTAGTTLRNTLFGRINGWFESNPTVTASINGSSILCQGSNVVLTSSPASSYLWNTGATTQSITVTAAGNFRVQATTAEGSAISNDIDVTVNPLPVISSQPTNQSVAEGSQAQFTVNSSTTGVTYQWQKQVGANFENLVDDAVYSGSTASSLVIASVNALDNGTVFRCVISKNGCNRTSVNVTLSIVTSVAGSIQINKLAYPNPAGSKLMVPVSDQVRELILSDLSGKELIRKKVFTYQQDQELFLDAIKPGIYQLTMTGSGLAPAVQKIMVQ